MTVSEPEEQQREAVQKALDELVTAANSYLKPSKSADAKEDRLALAEKATRLAQTLRGPVPMALSHFESVVQIAALRTLMEAGVFEAIPSEGASISADEISARTGLDKNILVRLMRAVTALGPFRETGKEQYSHTPFSEAYLTPDISGCFPVMSDFIFGPVLQICQFLRQNNWKGTITTRNNPFTLAHNCPGETMFEYLYKRPDRVAPVTRATDADPEQMAMDLYPWDVELGPLAVDDRVTIVDVGGSHGNALRGIKKAVPCLKGRFVLQDLDPVIQEHHEALRADGIEPMSLDFFKQVQPIKGAPVYYFRRVFHDWPDEPESKLILQNTAASMDRERSRILIHEIIVPEMGATMSHAWQDLTLMAIGGMERREKDFARLLDSAGLQLVKVWRKQGDMMGIVEARLNGIKVIIVGLGIAGLVAAIECYRKGHEIVGLERSPEIRVLGDSIALGSNATKVLQKWDNGEVLRQLVRQADDVAAMEILDPAGKVYAMDAMTGYGLGEGMIIHRGSLVTGLYEYAMTLGIDLRFGVAVTEYWEEGDSAGVTLDGEQRIAADCVIGADGVHSKAREFVLGYQMTPHVSGLAAFRACFDAGLLADDPEAAWILEQAGEHDRMLRYITTGGLGLTLATGKRGRNIIWQVWHRNHEQADESWANTTGAAAEDALALLQDWPVYSKIAPVLRHTPKDKLADYKIITRDPLPTWISGGGRLMLIGDAAHPASPIAGQGGGQAVEDAATLAIGLELAGRNQVKLALQAVQAIRYPRNCLIQESGNAIYSQMRDPDWEAVEKDPSLMKFPRPQWIFGYDVQQDVYEEFRVAMSAIQGKRRYQPRNIPSDAKYRILHDYTEGSN
ncbi:hypothetical protein CNMCM7691_000509 [Aspergillus felis]|uniref:O-methyltransferase n=1 Tax=Aspergillus felis TaxID=1287682 RepID=A0A8H6QW59_9EURO|nr:hypothetical protein CNMCM7691_000509 [Aspergillus felis]